MVGPIAKSFWENEEMGDLILDGIICVVDSRNILKVGLSPSRLVPVLITSNCQNTEKKGRSTRRKSEILLEFPYHTDPDNWPLPM